MEYGWATFKLYGRKIFRTRKLNPSRIMSYFEKFKIGNYYSSVHTIYTQASLQAFIIFHAVNFTKCWTM